jgi:hypothetical protein
VVSGRPYESVVGESVLGPLALGPNGFFTEEMIGLNFTASHNVVKGEPVPEPAFWPVPRSINPTGALISNAADQLRWARFEGRADRPAGGNWPGQSSGFMMVPSRGFAIYYRVRPLPVTGDGATIHRRRRPIAEPWNVRPSRCSDRRRGQTSRSRMTQGNF